jgi:catechol 2,3-dioxygenase-like lactoylglutathione lyase family enzyme
MEQRISLITLGVSDVARARRFYENLGWRASGASNPHIAFFQLGGVGLGLYVREALAEDARVSPQGAGFAGLTLSHNARTRDEVDRLLAEAVAAGGALLKPAQEVFWGGYSGYFADPDRHVWEIAWNPGFAIDEDGSIQLPD